MAVEVKVAPDNQLELKSVFLEDRRVTSQYFNLTELPDTFTGGKNAFLIAGTEYLESNTEVLVQIRDANGRIVYTESSDGSPEYYEGISKVIAVYVYPTDSVEQAIDSTAFGPCTITILGELKFYDNNGSKTEVPEIWKGRYNVRYIGQANINPNLANTTRVRFFKRPQVRITELLKPIYNVSGSAITASAIIASYANIKLSRLETFAGDVKRVKVYRSSVGTVSDFELIQDIQIEAKELLQTFEATGSVVTDTGFFNPEVLSKFWNTGSLSVALNTTQFSGSTAVRLNGSGNFRYTSPLDLGDITVYELSLDGFYTGSSVSDLEIYISGSQNGNRKVATINGLFPTRNFTNYTTQFSLPKSEPTASLYFKQTQSSWFLKDISLRASAETVFSPNEVSFVLSMPTNISNETFNFNFEFFDVNNNFIPVAVTGSQTFTGGNNLPSKLLTFESDRTAFRFSSGSIGNPAFQQVGFKVTKQNLSGSVTYASAAFDSNGNYIVPASYAGTYPGALTNAGDGGASLTIANFTGSLSSVLISSITYTASCDGLEEYETIYRFEDGENAPGLFVTANTNQFIYKATDLTLNPSGQIITIEAKRKNLASASTPLIVNSGSGKPPITYVSTNSTNGVDTYTLAGSSYPFLTSETIYSISGSDQFGNQFSDAIKITPIKILDGFSVAVTNENVSFPATSAGAIVGDLAASSGSITVKVGNETINYSSTFITNSFSASISSTSGLTANTFNGTNYSINTLSQDTGSLTLLVKYKDGGGTIISSSKDITYSKVKKAAPVLTFQIGNNNQTVTAKSTGAQIDAFLTASFTVNEAYNGSTTQKTFTPISITATNGYITGSTTATTLSLPNMADGTNSVDISITGSVVDSENTTRNVFGNISLAKTKKAIPNVVVTATPQAQSVLANPAGTQTGTLSNVTIAALEGSTNVFTSMVITSTTGFSTLPTVSGATLTMTSAVMNAAEGSVTLTITHTDSEGTTGQTKTIIVRATKVPTGADGAAGNNGTNGTNGTNGVTGPGVVHTGVWTSGRTYQFSDGLTDGTGRRDTVLWSSNGSAPYNTYYATTRQHLSATGNVANGAPNQAAQTGWVSLGTQDFFVAAKIGIFEESFVQNTLNIGTNQNGGLSSANITLAGGSANPYISIGQSALVGSQGYNLNGIFLGQSSGVSRLSLKSAANSLLWDGTNLNISGNITAGTIQIGNNFSVTANGDLTARNAFLTGKIEAASGKIGSGTNFWTIGPSSIENNLTTTNGKISLNAARPAIEVYNASNELKIDINGGTEFTSRTIPNAINTSGGITGNFQVGSENVASNPPSSGASYYNSTQTIYTGQNLSFSPGANVGKTATLKITSVGDAGYSFMEANGTVSLNSISATYGYLIRKGSNNGTIVATLSDSVANSISSAGTNSLPDYSKVFSTSILLENVTYFIVPFVQNLNVLGYSSDGLITTLTGFVNTPKVTSATVTFDVGKTEIIAGGIQIIRDTGNYFQVDRGAQSGDIVLIGGKVSVTGSMSLTGDLTANTSSDIRLKTNIQRIPNSMDKILKISGNTFQWLSGFDEIHSHSGNDVGVIAQEIESVLPEIVVNRDNGYKGVHYEKLVALLIEGMKELQYQIDELKNNK